MQQKGLAPILIVILIALALGIGGYVVYQKRSVPSSKPITTPSPIPTSTSTPQPSPKSTTKPKTSIKPTVKVTPKPTPLSSPSPSPSGSPSPTSKPSPVPGVYHLDLKPTSDIQMSTTSQGYIASILLKDSNGDTVYDQSDFSFSASIDNPIATISLLNGDWMECKYDNIKYDTSGYNSGLCPNYRLSIDNQKAGSAKIPVKAIQKSTGKVVAEGTYTLTVK